MIFPARTMQHLGLTAVFAIVFVSSGRAQSSSISVTQTNFSIVDRGGASRTGGSTGNTVAVGYARIQPNAGNTTPAGLAIFGLQLNGTLVSEVGVPAARLVQTGRIYAEVGSAINTGIAIANPSDRDAAVSFFFTDSSGTDFGAGTAIVPANGQISKFLDQAPFNGGSNIRGTFSFSSNVPVSVVALRGLLNERSEFLMSSLTVVDTSATRATTNTTLPHFAAGGGWTTQIILVNPSDSAIGGDIRFVTPTGEALDTVPFVIPRRSSFKTQTSGTGSSVQTGSVQVVRNSGDAAPSSLAIFSYKTAGITVSEAAIASTSGTMLRMYAEIAGAFGAIGSKQSGVAIANPGSSPARVRFELTSFDGSLLATSSIVIPGNGQIAKFLNDIFPSQTLPSPLQGVLRIATDAGISVVGLRGRYNERGDFLVTTTPPTNEEEPASSAELVFPEVVSGGGYSTQFLIFSGSTGQRSDGTIRFLNQDGTPQTLNWPVSRVGGTVTEPVVASRVEPQYSDAARAARIQGTVVMQAVVHEDGSLSIVRIIQKLGFGLDENAQSALEQWRFRPAMQAGQPVAVSLNVEVNFILR